MTRNEILAVKELSTVRGRREQGLFIAEGEKLVGEIISSGLKVNRVFQTEPLFENGEMVEKREMERISQLKTPTAVLCLAEIPRHELLEVNPSKSLVLALDCVQNPGNLGTIIRLADWFGIEDVVCSSDSADCFSPKVVQATMGAMLRVKVHYTDLPKWLKDQKCRIYGTFLEGKDIYDEKLSPSGVILMGNEGRGVSEACARSVTDKLFIPPFPASRHGSESLNVAIATSVVCSEFRRRMR